MVGGHAINFNLRQSLNCGLKLVPRTQVLDSGERDVRPERPRFLFEADLLHRIGDILGEIDEPLEPILNAHPDNSWGGMTREHANPAKSHLKRVVSGGDFSKPLGDRLQSSSSTVAEEFEGDM